MQIFWIFAIAFFAFMTVYNTLTSIKRKETFAPAIIGFLMTMAVLSCFLGKIIYGILFFVASVIVSRAKSSEISKIEEKRISQEFEKIDDEEPLKLKDFLFGWKAWRIIAVRHGAKKAAFLLSLFFAIILILMFLLLWKIFPDFVPNKYFLLEFIILFPVIHYYVIYKKFNRIFENIIRT